jgi:flagellar motility protein MotE (MotC chaperone)
MTLALLPQRLRRLSFGIGSSWRPSLLAVTAATASVAAVANAVAMATPAVPDTEVPTRLGTSLAQSMSDRDRALSDRNRALELREQATRAAEQRLRNDLQTSQPAADAALASAPGQSPASPQDAMFGNLARIYQTMKPNRAAPIFEKLALDVQVQVAKRMREGQTAQIMAAMTPDSAVELSMALAGRQVVKAPPAPAIAPRPNAALRPNAAPQSAARRRTSPIAIPAPGAPAASGPRGPNAPLAAPAVRTAVPPPSDGAKAGKAGAR